MLEHRAHRNAMAEPPSIQQQLAALLGRDVKQVRKTDEQPPRVSVIDVISAILGVSGNVAAVTMGRMKAEYPEVTSGCCDFKFKGRGQRDTPVTCVCGIVEIVMLLPGRHAAHVRRQAAELLTRYLGGDLALIKEICHNRGIQAELAGQSHGDPRRLFGEAVEAGAGTIAVSEQQQGQLARICTDIVARAIPGMLDRITAHIDERLTHLQSRQRVNLNVRAPKRPAPYARPLTRDISHAGRPFPVAKFIDEKKRADPTLKDVRKSFSPGFSMLVQILKKNQLRRVGAAAIYVEQNNRPQILYTEADRPIMEEAWGLTEAHREDLAGLRHSVAGALPAASGSSSSRPRPSVMDLLRGP